MTQCKWCKEEIICYANGFWFHPQKTEFDPGYFCNTKIDMKKWKCATPDTDQQKDNKKLSEELQ